MKRFIIDADFHKKQTIEYERIANLAKHHAEENPHKLRKLVKTNPIVTKKWNLPEKKNNHLIVPNLIDNDKENMVIN